jgi:hypothetical protein
VTDYWWSWRLVSGGFLLLLPDFFIFFKYKKLALVVSKIKIKKKLKKIKLALVRIWGVWPRFSLECSLFLLPAGSPCLVQCVVYCNVVSALE